MHECEIKRKIKRIALRLLKPWPLFENEQYERIFYRFALQIHLISL